MKKHFLLLALVTLVTSGVFAQHPDGWGVGAGFQLGSRMHSGYSDLILGASLFLKVPQVPIYWGISIDPLEMGNEATALRFMLTGDFKLIHNPLLPSIGLSWFLSAGAYFGLWHQSWDIWPGTSVSGSLIDLGLRVPIGLSLMPGNTFEFFFALVPSAGAYFFTGDFDGSGFAWGFQGDIGIRFWF